MSDKQIKVTIEINEEGHIKINHDGISPLILIGVLETAKTVVINNFEGE